MTVAADKKTDEIKGSGPERTIGLLSAINIIIGIIIGSGIFVTPTAALRYSGSVGFTLVVWAACGLITLLGALCFAELGTVIPRSGGEYTYLLETFSKFHKFWGPLPAFLCSWLYLTVLRPAACAVTILTCADYSIQPFRSLLNYDDWDESSKVNLPKLVAILYLAIITYINLVSTKLYLQINNIFTFGKLIACLVIICVGIYQLIIGNTENLRTGFQGTTTNPGHIAFAFYNGLWAYDGWPCVTSLTEEIKNPEKNLPRSIAIAIPIVTALYVFMNLAYMTVLTPAEMINAPAVAVEFGNKVLGPAAFIIPLGVALSTFGCVLSIQFSTTRICSVSGSEGHFLEAMSYFHIRRMTPAPAVALLGFMTFLLVVVGNINALIEFASFLIWVIYGTAMACVLILRKTQPNTPRPYQVPVIIPIFTVSVAVFLSIMPIVTDPSIKYVFALAFVGLGIIIYTLFVYYRRRPKIMDKVTYLMQLLFEVAPNQYSQVAATDSD